jgi:hypothetical protein
MLAPELFATVSLTSVYELLIADVPDQVYHYRSSEFADHFVVFFPPELIWILVKINSEAKFLNSSKSVNLLTGCEGFLVLI